MERPGNGDDVARLAGLIAGLQRRHGSFRMEVPFGLVVSLVANLQLALRHPDNTGPASEEVRGFARCLIALMEEWSPGVGHYLNMGWDPAHDTKGGPR